MMKNPNQIDQALGKIKERIVVIIVKRLDIMRETAVRDVDKEILDRDRVHLVVVIKIKVGLILENVEIIEKGRHPNIVETVEREEIAAIVANPDLRVRVEDIEMKESTRHLIEELIMIMIVVSEIFVLSLIF